MANGAAKPDEWTSETNVMESGLLRVLKKSSSKNDTGGYEPLIEVIVDPAAGATTESAAPPEDTKEA
ncbi:MAG TPA: hypothetical protein VF945_07055, partial [Polyangia bacterium]